MKPRRVLHITRVAEGGVPAVVDRIVTKLDRNRYEPIVIFDTHIKSHTRDKLSNSGIKTIALKEVRNKQISDLTKIQPGRDIGGWVAAHFGKEALKIYLSLRSFHEFIRHQAPRVKIFHRIIRENRVDLVHSHNDLHFGKSEMIAARRANIPCICHIHGYPDMTQFDRMFSRFVHTFIYISTDVAEKHNFQRKTQDKGIIIHNGVDLTEYLRDFDPSIIRSEFGIKPDEPLVGIIGRIDWWKGYEYFIEAIALASKQISGLKGLIVGKLAHSSPDRNRPYLDKLHSLVKSLSLENNIIFTGFRSDIPQLMASLDLVLHASSIPEPFGLVVIEGMAAGKPVIATAEGGVLDIIQNGVNGLLIPCKDSKAMAQAIIRLLSDRTEADQMGLEARRRVFEKFTVEHQVMAVQKLYDWILGISLHPSNDTF